MVDLLCAHVINVEDDVQVSHQTCYPNQAHGR